MKVSAIVEIMETETLRIYGKLCGWTLARAHARSGDPAMISGYLGKSDVFDQAIVKFAAAYADQTESDHQRMRKAARAGRLEAAVVE
jgi:NAD(P)H-dependent flavin oxidoreductase YrpB (nitropropane dioxygenase family)